MCSRWQWHFSRLLESQLYWEHLETTECWSKVGWRATVKPFSRNTKMILEKKLCRERTLQKFTCFPVKGSFKYIYIWEKWACPKAKSSVHYDLLNKLFFSPQISLEPMSASQNTFYGSKSACAESPDISCANPPKHFHISTWVKERVNV